MSNVTGARFDVCVVGSSNLDLVATAEVLPRPGETVIGHDFTEHPGGKGLNQAVASARAGRAHSVRVGSSVTTLPACGCSR